MAVQLDLSTLLNFGALIGMLIGVMTYRAKLRTDLGVVVQEKTEIKIRLEQAVKDLNSLGEKVSFLKEDHGNRLTEAEKNFALQDQKLDQIIEKLDRITEVKACS